MNGVVMSQYSNFTVDLDNTNSSWTILFNMIKPGSNVLDVGCSSGYFDAVLIERKNCIVDGIELDHQDAKAARKICRDVFEGNIETMDLKPLEERRYDYILFVDVIEHLTDPSGALRRIKELLAPGGQILFSVPNMAHASVRLQLLRGQFEYENEGLLDRTHLHFYNRNNLLEVINDSGLFLSKIDRTIHDLPRDIIEAALGEVGLSATESFVEYMNTDEAVTYQFVGSMIPTKADQAIESIEYPDKPLDFYRSQLLRIQEEARQFWTDMQGARRERDEKEVELQKMRAFQNKPSLPRRVIRRIKRSSK